MAAAVGQYGLGILGQLGKLVASLYLALILFVVCLLTLVKLYSGIRIRTALRELEEPLVLAFSTTSSESALPKAIAATPVGVMKQAVLKSLLYTGFPSSR